MILEEIEEFMHPTKNDLPETIRAKRVELLNARLWMLEAHLQVDR